MDVIHSGPVLSNEMRNQLSLNFFPEEIKLALQSITDNKAPRIDGYNNKFYKAAWSVIGDGIVHAI